MTPVEPSGIPAPKAAAAPPATMAAEVPTAMSLPRPANGPRLSSLSPCEPIGNVHSSTELVGVAARPDSGPPRGGPPLHVPPERWATWHIERPPRHKTVAKGN